VRYRSLISPHLRLLHFHRFVPFPPGFPSIVLYVRWLFRVLFGLGYLFPRLRFVYRICVCAVTHTLRLPAVPGSPRFIWFPDFTFWFFSIYVHYTRFITHHYVLHSPGSGFGWVLTYTRLPFCCIWTTALRFHVLLRSVGSVYALFGSFSLGSLWFISHLLLRYGSVSFP